MKNMLAGLLLAVAVPSYASPYLRPFDPANIYQSAGCGFDTTGHAPAACTAAVAVLTHDTADGSIIPWAWQPLLPPEDWAVAFGGGGSFKGEAIISGSLTFNVAPQIAALAFKAVSASSPLWVQNVKAFAEGSANPSLRLGAGFYGTVVHEGHFQSFAAAFPGSGIVDIMNRSKRVEVGVAWKIGSRSLAAWNDFGNKASR